MEEKIVVVMKYEISKEEIEDYCENNEINFDEDNLEDFMGENFDDILCECSSSSYIEEVYQEDN